VTLQAMVETALEISRPHLERARHRVEVALPPEPLAMHADPVRVAQVVANLLNNAAKFTPAGGRISLGARRDGDAALITVADDGRGIAADALGGLFEMFAASGGAHPRDGGGLGIGLPLSRKLVELHGGTIQAKSDGPERGAEFVVRLPLGPLEENAARLGGSEARVAQVGHQHVAGRVGDAEGRPRFQHH
jgi:signal transduction histidine kinase